MGLDISFNLKPALDAGLVTRVIVESGMDFGNDVVEPERITILINIPDTDHWTASSTHIYKNVAKCMVRANHWGSMYKPLTDWLKSHDIEWVES